ncbi:MAG: hypothetical protein EOO20_13930 [Chryseobacterium sp.]|nr:MAG: hypothetical protein EOO20_13930 [Chryseobacterium sp.]
MQGETIEKEYIIYDVEHINANSNWFYTAITRCQYLDKVYIYTGASLGGAIDWNGKIRGYKEQDEKAGRNGFDLTVSSVKDLCAKANYCCTHCRGIVAMIYEAGDDDQWTLDRIDDGSAHRIGNVQLSHLSCNRALGFLAKK